MGTQLDPEVLTDRTGIGPSTAHKAGEPMLQGTRVRGHRNAGLWALSSEGSIDSTGLDAHLSWLLDRLEQVADVIGDVRSGQGLRADFFCFWVSRHGHGV